MVLLKKLEYLTTVLNLSLATHIAPEASKIGMVVPTLKPNQGLTPPIRRRYPVTDYQHEIEE